MPVMVESTPKYARSRAELAQSRPHRRLLGLPRGLAGALLGALIPYSFGAFLHGPLLGGNPDAYFAFGGLMLFFAFLGFCAFTGRWKKANKAEYGELDFLPHENIDRVSRAGRFS